MVLAFPRTFPTALRPVGLSFELAENIERSPSRAGRQHTGDLGPWLWRGAWRRDALDAEAAGQARAWVSSLMGREFYAYDALRQYPLAYARGWPDAFGGFDGTGALVAVDAGKELIDLAQLAAGLVLSEGDMLAWDYGDDSRALHRVTEGGTADGGGEVTVSVVPYVRTGWVLSPETVVHLYRPAARMIIIPGSYSAPIEAGDFVSVSFDAIQTL